MNFNIQITRALTCRQRRDDEKAQPPRSEYGDPIPFLKSNRIHRVEGGCEGFQ